MRVILVILSILAIESVHPDLIVEIGNGKILGQTLSTVNNKSFHSFQGIPFAKPPVGDLRFKPPQKPDDWEGILDDNNAKKMCIQTSLSKSPNESEDCLYLNVYTPQLPTDGKNVSFPVMFVIHGGAFLHGSANIDTFGPQYLMDYEIIVVVIQYRLGFFGFVSTGDLVCPGNNGFRDQQLALRWVQDNIHSFGGDPRNVTIFGESAGGASVSYQLLGSHSKGLYRGAIQNSGSALSLWSSQKNPKSNAYKFASHINSTINETNTSTEDLMNFFRTLEVSQVKEASAYLFGENIIGNLWNLINGFGFMGVIEPQHEDAFLTETAYNKFSSGNFNVVPTMIGFNSEEALFLNQDPNLLEKLENFDRHTELLVSHNMHLTDPIVSQKVGGHIRKMYVKDGLLHKNKGMSIKYFSESCFCRPIIKQAQLQSNYTDVYLFELAYSGIMGSGKVPVEIPGAGKVVHGEDLKYLFHKKTAAALHTYPEKDIINMKRMLTLWTNFVKYQNPTPSPIEITQNIIWPKLSPGGKTPNLHIDEKLEVQYDSRKAMVDEYDRLYKLYAVPPLDTY